MRQKEGTFLSRKFKNMLKVSLDKMRDARLLLRTCIMTIPNNKIKLKYREKYPNF